MESETICFALPAMHWLPTQFLLADGCVAALDISIQTDFLNLLKSLQQSHDLRFLFISHGSCCANHNSVPDVLPGLGRDG